MVSCDVYKSDRRELMYLYVLEGEGLERVPAALMKSFGNPTFVLNVELTPDKALAKEDPKVVIEHLETCLLYTSPSPRDQRGSRMPSSA